MTHTTDDPTITNHHYYEATMRQCAKGHGDRACLEFEGFWLCLKKCWRHRERVARELRIAAGAVT